MMTYENATGSQGAPEPGASCPGCGSPNVGRASHDPNVFRCRRCSRNWRPAAAAVEALPEPAPSDAVTAAPADILARALDAGLVDARGAHLYYDGQHIGHGERAALDALEADPALLAGIAAELDAIAADSGPGAEEDEG